MQKALRCDLKIARSAQGVFAWGSQVTELRRVYARNDDVIVEAWVRQIRLLFAYARASSADRRGRTFQSTKEARVSEITFFLYSLLFDLSPCQVAVERLTFGFTFAYLVGQSTAKAEEICTNREDERGSLKKQAL